MLPESTLFSIVINNYNYARYLPECLDSALAQTWKNVEVIVVDDGSADNSREVLALYESRVQIINKANGGQGSCYNVGFAASQGAIVCFLDSDDVLDINACSMAAGHKWTGCSKMQGFLRLIDENSRPIGKIIPFNRFEEVNPYSAALRFYAYSSPPGSGNFYSRQYLKMVMPMEADRWRISADAYLIFRAPFHGKVTNIREHTVGDYRIHASSASGAKKGGFGEKEIFDYARREYLKELKRKSVVRDYYSFIFGHNATLHDTPSLIKLRILLHLFRVRKRRRAVFWLPVFARSFYVLAYWDYYTIQKRFMFMGWVLFCYFAPRKLTLKLASHTIYAYRRGY